MPKTKMYEWLYFLNYAIEELAQHTSEDLHALYEDLQQQLWQRSERDAGVSLFFRAKHNNLRSDLSILQLTRNTA